MKPNEMITELQILVMKQLVKLPPGHVYSKDFLYIKTGIKSPYLEAVLKDLKSSNVIKRDHRMREDGMFSGSGYRLTNEGRKKINSINYLERKNKHWENLEIRETEKSNKNSWLNRFFSKFV